VRLLALLCLTVASSAGSRDEYQRLDPACSSEIYCHGPMLHAIQMARLYNDSKTFVDKKLRHRPELVLQEFHQLPELVSKEELQRFVDAHFDAEGSEFESWHPTDWVQDPQFLAGIADAQLRRWGRALHSDWKFLGRQIKEDVAVHPELYSMIYVANPFIVPGGRFREFYYWDSYWIVKGLLVSEMHQTVKGMLENFIHMVDVYGLVPNGGRVYYEQRSQPPMLTPMVDAYVTATDDIQFLQDNIHLLEKELDFWLKNRTVEVKGHRLCRFNVEIDGPRPESYKEDYEAASELNSGASQQQFYINTKSGAESGWDFSSRWYIVDGHNKGNMSHINTRNIIPVDLNSFIYMNHIQLARLFRLLGDENKAQFYDAESLVWSRAIDEVLWNDDQGIWLDYDILNDKPRPYFYASNLVPLWAGCGSNSSKMLTVVESVLDYLEESRAADFAGGVPTSMLHSGQQWDFPNAWPPLQHMLVVGLEKTGQPEAQAVAFQLAQKWLLNNFYAYQEASAMFEKYDATVLGLAGGGGEYDVQLGFGWTNGVVLDFLNMYGDRLYSSEEMMEQSNSIDDNDVTMM